MNTDNYSQNVNHKGDCQNFKKSRAKKRKFNGNRYSIKSSTEETSTAAKKLKDSNSFDASYNTTTDYVFLSFTQFFLTLSTFVKCSICKDKITFLKTCVKGLGFQVEVRCKRKKRIINSCNKIGTDYEINRKFIFVMRLIGVGIRGIKLFCSMMDLSHSYSNYMYYRVLKDIKISTKSVYDMVLEKACFDEKKIFREKGLSEDLFTVSGDGTWAKRGFSSLVGVSSLIGKYSGKVLDLFVSCK